MTVASFPILLRDAILTRVKALPYFATFSFSTNRMLQIQPDSLPLSGVYFLQENSLPDGDANAGQVRFRTTVRIGFSVIIINNDPDLAEHQLDTAYQVLVSSLLADETLYNGSQVKVQGFASGARTHVFGNAGSNNETPIAELRWDLVCDLGVIDYPPVVLDDLDLIHVRTGFPLGGTQAEQDAVQQVVSEYDLPQ